MELQVLLFITSSQVVNLTNVTISLKLYILSSSAVKLFQ